MYAAARNRAFFSAYNAFILRSCHENLFDRALISCWAAVTTEAVAGMMDQAKKGRREIQEQNEHDVLTQILPLLDEGLALRDVGDMRIACYMTLTVIASKTQLRVDLLNALMDAVVSSWTPDTTHAGLICLAVLAQNKKDLGLTRKTFDAITSIKTLNDDLFTLKEKYRIDRLVFSLFQCILGTLEGSQKLINMSYVVSVFENSLLDATYSKRAIRVLLSAANKLDFTTPGSSKLLGQLADLIQGLSNDEVYRSMVLSAIQDDNIDLEQLQAKLQTNLQLEESYSQSDVEMVEAEKPTPNEDFQKALHHIPTGTTPVDSFLTQLDSYLFASLLRAFLLCTNSAKDLLHFCNLPKLGRPLAMDKPLYFSFFFRVACSSLPLTARSTALRCLIERLQEVEPVVDLQMFFPYLLYNLSDPVPKVRNAAADLASMLLTKYKRLSDSHTDQETLTLGRSNLYGNNYADFKSVLKFANAVSFLEDILGPVLDECRLDAEHVSRRIDAFLRNTLQAKHVASDAKAFRKSSRMALLQTLASHIIATPIYSVKLRLLSMLGSVGKIGHTSRTKCLKSMIEAYQNHNAQQFREPLVQAQVDEQVYVAALVGILVPTDSDGLELLHRLVNPERGLWPPQIQAQAHRHIRSLWSDLKPGPKDAMVKELFGLTTKEWGRRNDIVTSQALETLQNVSIPATAFVSILDDLPRLGDMPKSPSSAKRRRKSYSHDSSHLRVTDENIRATLGIMTVALELMETSETARDEILLPSLFQILEDILHCKSALGAGLGYILSLTLSCIRSVMETIEVKYLQTLFLDELTQSRAFNQHSTGPRFEPT